MISNIIIQNFKSLKDIEFKCSNLTLLSGLNGMGKSSVIQALLLLRQSKDMGTLDNNGLKLNGELASIGVGKDALYQFAEKEEIKFGILFKGGDTEYQWLFEYSKNVDDKEYKYTDSDILPFSGESPKYDLDSLPLFDSHFKYLSADRWVRNQYDKSDSQVIHNRNLGKHGQYTTHYLVHYGLKKEEEVHESLLFFGTKIKTLDYQVSAWMNEISPGSMVKAGTIPGVNEVKLRYQLTTTEGPSEEILATNAGFGMTYVLPVIVALLSAKPGDIIIIENPESHVHAQGQSAIGRLMGKVAQLGIQVFIETHSDHILNGVCISIGKGELQATNANFYFLHKNHNELFTTKYQVAVAENGRIDDRSLRNLGVKGFFDQINKDLETILFNPSTNG